MKLHIDLESYSELNLTKVGTYRYAVDPSTKVELLSYAINDQQPNLWRVFEEYHAPKDFCEAFANPDVELHAFNAPFERVMLRDCLGFDSPPSRWHCTMVRAWALGFAGGLAAVGEEIGLAPDKAKLKDGNTLVLKFRKPAPRTHKVDRYDWENSPEEWARYEQYNLQDVIAAREILAFLEHNYAPETPWDRAMWVLDQEINDKGLPLDRILINSVLRMIDTEKRHLTARLRELTQLKNPNSNAQFLQWAQENVARNIQNVQRSTLEAYQGIEAVTLKLQLMKTSTTKWAALQRAASEHDGRIRGTLQYAGAQRTKRWAGRIFQPQNLPRPGIKKTEIAADAICTEDTELIEMLYDRAPMDLFSDTIRSAVTAPHGYQLVVADLAGIEGRVLPWLCDFTSKLDRIRAGADEYVYNASITFNVPQEQVTDNQRLVGKVQELSLGYQGWINAFNSMAKNYGTEFTEDESKTFILSWRERNRPIVQFWKTLESVIKAAYDTPGQAFSSDKLKFMYNRGDLLVALPSGRAMLYYQFQVDIDGSMSYMGQNSYTRKWERLQTYGGKMAENLTQAVARDVLVVGLLRAKAAGLDIRGHVHDEIICVSTQAYAQADLQTLIHAMAADIDWAPGLPLAAEGYTAKRYKK